MRYIFTTTSNCKDNPKRIARTNKILLVIVIAALASLLCGCIKRRPAEFNRVVTMKPTPYLGINNIRLVALKQASRGVGAQAGLAWRSKQINKILLGEKNNLDRIFNFNYLILNNNVLPPVLVEGRNTLNLDNNAALRIADRDYQIEAYPRFITAPPSWRDYLWMNYKKPEMPNATLLPKNAKESKVWNKYIKIGWNEGIRQAEEIFDTNLGRLKRDYGGMVLYRKLLAQNMVSAPFVSKADLGVTGGGRVLRINDRILRITAIPNLKANSKAWKPIIATDGEVDSLMAAKYRAVKGKIGGRTHK